MITEITVKRFGEKLHALRTGRRITLKQLADALGLASHGYLSELEHGKKIPTVEFVLKLSHFFNITTDELLKDELELSDFPTQEGKRK